jgi:serine/threonine protein kinase/tetratricopeptide (TPR) repeat protein
MGQTNRPEPAPSPALNPFTGDMGMSPSFPVGNGYVLVKRLGSGGFGEVWQAQAPGGIPVAIKIIFRSLDHQDSKNEMQALELIKGLRHPFLLPVLGFWTLQDRLLIAMELADGSLRDRLNACRRAGLPGIPVAELLTYFRGAAEGLDYLHEQHVHHRDVKPDNVLLLGRHAKLADFGMVSALQNRSLVTVSGSGTPAYMPPEMWGGKVSLHSDQYSLAATYAEVRLTRRLFTGSELVDQMVAHLQKTPDLAPLAEPEQRVLLRALAKDPGQRFPSCQEFVQALEQALAPAAGVAPPVPPPPAPPVPEPEVPATQITLAPLPQAATPSLPIQPTVCPAVPPIAIPLPEDSWGLPAPAPARRWWPWVVVLLVAVSLPSAAAVLWYLNNGDGPPTSPKQAKASSSSLVQPENQDKPFSKPGPGPKKGQEDKPSPDQPPDQGPGKAKPLDAAGYNRLGLADFAQGKSDRAIANFQKAIRLDANFAAAYKNLADAYAQKKSFDRAIEAYGEALRLEPHNAAALYRRAYAYLHRNPDDYDRALADAVAALRLDPEDAEASSRPADAAKFDPRRTEAEHQKFLDLLKAAAEQIEDEQKPALELVKKLSGVASVDVKVPSKPVRKVILGGAIVTDGDLARLKGLTQLRELYLAGTAVGDAGLAHLRGLSRLRVLNLKGSQVGDAGLAHLKGLADLQRLDLTSTRISGAGLAHLKGLTKLRELYLGKTKVDDDGLAHLSGLAQLRRLDLTGTAVSAEAIDQLKKALPDVQIAR